MQKDRNKMKTGMRKVAAVAALLLCSSVALAQSQTTGVITDSNGDPLVGVTVLEVGTNNGTVTDINGRYTLKTSKPRARLKVSYVGYNDQVINPGQSVTLEEDDKTLNEVVVVGYGTMRRKDVTSSITSVKAEDLNTGVFSDPASMLQGKVAGLVVTSSGDPSGSPSITLRGASSLRTGDAMQPYYVIDGIPGVDISMVAPDDIESIDVLRDATATAIYGSKAANGVIIINTKRGKSGQERTNVSYNAYIAIDNVRNNLDMASADELRDYASANGLTIVDGGANTDWQDEVQRTALTHSHNLSISGGAKKTTYMASVSYQNREGVIKGSDFERFNVRSLVSSKVLKDKLDLSVGVNHRYAKANTFPTSSRGQSVLDAMNYYSPTLGVTNEDGSWTTGSGSQNYNPVALIEENTSESMYKNTQVVAKASLEIIKGLTWNANYSYTHSQYTYSSYYTHDSQLEGISAQNGQATRSTYFGDAHTFETYGNYDTTIADVHKLGIMAGYSWEEKNTDDGFGLTVHDFYDDTVKWYNLTYASTIDGISAVQSGTKQTVRNISFYGRVSYSYDSRYMLQATIRRDGSSVFGENNRWGTFPSISAAWNITEEDFMKDQNIFSNLKLRLGYGVSGNALGFGAYSAVATYGSTGSTFTYDGKNWITLGATKNANPDLKWEKTGMFNVGIDYALLKGRINGTLEFYHKKTKDLIWDYPVSTNVYPYSTIAANVGEITNKGVEFTINFDAIRSKDFRWTTSLNLSHNKNTVDKLSNDVYSVSEFTQGDPDVAGVSSNGFTQRIMEGESLGTFYLFEFAGYNDEGKAVYYERDEETGERTGTTTVDPQYKDRYIAGCAMPKISIGWNNTFSYKNWSASMFWTGSFGGKIYNSYRAQYTSPSLFSGDKNVLKEYIYDRPATDTGSNIPSTRFLESGDYVRLKSLTIGYTFRNLADWMQSIQVYVTGNNLLTITGYDGLDPEVNLGGIDPGIEYRTSRYPQTRTIMFGAKFNF